MLHLVPVSFTAVGELMLDLGITSGDEPHNAAIYTRVGGTAANAAVWAAAAGASAACVGRVGDDAAGLAIRAALEERGVAVELTTDPEARTGVVALVDGDLLVDRGANRSLSVSDLRALDADAVLVSGYALLHEDSAQAARVALAGSAGWTAATAGSPGLLRRVVPYPFAGARLLVANAAEARALTGSEPAEAARLLAKRHELAGVTLGADGALLATAERLLRCAGTTIAGLAAPGAGDAFAAALLVALAEGVPPEAALEAACAAGAAAAASADGWP